MEKLIKAIILIFSLSFLTFNTSFSLECLKINIKPLKERLVLDNSSKDFLEFNVYFENNCEKDLNLNLVYNDFVYYVYFQPNKFFLPKNAIKEVNIKIYPPSYISSGWKAVRINVYSLNKKINEFYLKFYLKNPNYKVKIKKEYVYLVKTFIQNVDLYINAKKEVKSWLNKKEDFYIVLEGLNYSLLEKKDFELIVIGKKGEKELKLNWNYLNNLNNDYLEIKGNKLYFKNNFLADFSVEPGLYTLEAFFSLKDEDFEISEKSSFNLLVEGSPYFLIEEKKEKGLFKTVIIYKIKNIGNKEGVYEFNFPLNFFKKLFINYDFEAKIEGNKLVKNINLKPGESETLLITYNYTSLIVVLIIVFVVSIVYYYLNYHNPIIIKKDITKISLSKDKKSFYVEVTIKNNSLRKFKDITVLEKVSNGIIDELSVVPKHDYIKKDLSLSKIRWTIKELKPQERVKLLFKILVKDSSTVVSYPTKVRINERIYLGKGLRIHLKDNIKIEEFEEDKKTN